MITGVVTAEREAILPLRIFGPDDRTVEIEAVVDTGFDGFLTLPAHLIKRLDLPVFGRVQAALGDGSNVPMAGFAAAVKWNDQERGILALQAEGPPLLGMAMLFGSRLLLDAEENGFVGVEPLPQRPLSAPS